MSTLRPGPPQPPRSHLRVRRPESFVRAYELLMELTGIRAQELKTWKNRQGELWDWVPLTDSAGYPLGRSTISASFVLRSALRSGTTVAAIGERLIERDDFGTVA